MRNPRCSVAGCTRPAFYGSPPAGGKAPAGKRGSADPRFCHAHRLSSHINRRSSVCVEEGCARQASWGDKAAGVPSQRCGTHRLVGDRNLRSKRCSFPGPPPCADLGSTYRSARLRRASVPAQAAAMQPAAAPRCTWVKGGAAVEQVRRAWLRQAPHAWPGHRVGTTAVPCSCRSGLHPRGGASVSGLRVHSARALRSAFCLARGPGQRREQGGVVRGPPARGRRGCCDASLHRTGLHAPGAVRARDSAARRQAVVRRTQVRGHGQPLDPPAPLPRRRLRASSHPRAPHRKR